MKREIVFDAMQFPGSDSLFARYEKRYTLRKGTHYIVANGRNDIISQHKNLKSATRAFVKLACAEILAIERGSIYESGTDGSVSFEPFDSIRIETSNN